MYTKSKRAGSAHYPLSASKAQAKAQAVRFKRYRRGKFQELDRLDEALTETYQSVAAGLNAMFHEFGGKSGS